MTLVQLWDVFGSTSNGLLCDVVSSSDQLRVDFGPAPCGLRHAFGTTSGRLLSNFGHWVNVGSNLGRPQMDSEPVLSVRLCADSASQASSASKASQAI